MQDLQGSKAERVGRQSPNKFKGGCEQCPRRRRCMAPAPRARARTAASLLVWRVLKIRSARQECGSGQGPRPACRHFLRPPYVLEIGGFGGTHGVDKYEW
jgi:hypothetical protein